MELIMEPVRKVEELFGKDMAMKMGAAVAERAARQAALRSEDFERSAKWSEAARAPIDKVVGRKELEASCQPVVAEMTGIARGNPPASGTAARTEPIFPLLPTPHSCVTGFGPYNAWGEGHGGGAGEAALHNGPGAQTIGGQVRYAFGGSGNVWGGSGCWFNVPPRRDTTLRVDFASNAHCYLGPLGYASGSISLHGSVWGANAGGWVDFGGQGVDLVHSYVFAAWRVHEVQTHLSVPFDASAGGAFYCAGWFSVWGGCGGLSACNVDLASFMAPLRVCTP